MDTKKVLAFIILVIIASACNNTSNCTFTDEFLSRFINPGIDAGYIVVPQNEKRFLIIESNTLNEIVYRGFYFEAYYSYGMFLRELMNNPSDFNLCKVANICKSFSRDLSIEAICKTDFEFFKNKYLESLESGIFGIKDAYSDKSPQIIKACFDNGYFIYWDCHSAEWYIHQSPAKACPVPPDSILINSFL